MLKLVRFAFICVECEHYFDDFFKGRRDEAFQNVIEADASMEIELMNVYDERAE